MKLIEARAPMGTSYYDPKEDAEWNHWACPRCGWVWKLPTDEAPWCTGCGGSGNYCYNHFTKNYIGEDWTRCVPVKVYSVEPQCDRYVLA